MTENAFEKYYDPEFPFVFFNQEKFPEKTRCKVYNDGTHCVLPSLILKTKQEESIERRENATNYKKFLTTYMLSV